MNIPCRKPPERFRQKNDLTGGNMTKKEFKEAMLRGHGRCILAVRQEPEKFRDLVLWACQRNIAYDAQSEGTRAWYVYTMVKAYPDPEVFIHAVAESLQKYRSNSSWDLLHLSELLMFFAMDGYEAARLAVEEKYQQLLVNMHQRRRRPSGLFHALSDLEQLGLVLSVDSSSFLRIAGDFGRLYQKKKYMEDGDFPWFFASKAEHYKKSLLRAARKDTDIACFIAREQAYLEAQKNESPSMPLTGSRLSRWLATKADPETINHYARIYREQDDPILRAQALIAFSHCRSPGDPQLIIEDAQSTYEPLQQAAWNALEHIRHPMVRHFALDNVFNQNRTLETFSLLITNYQPKDINLLQQLLLAIIHRKDPDEIHWAGMDVFRAFYKNSGIPHPKDLLPLLYEFDPCSYCRQTALQYLAKHRILTREMLNECLYDSNDDIRRMAERKLSQ